MNEPDSRSQLLVVLASYKLAWIAGVVSAALIAGDSPAAAALTMVVSLLLGAFLLRPVRLADAASGAGAIGVLRRFRWEWWRSGEIESVRYVHRPGMLRGTARLELTTIEGAVVALPGTTGRMLVRSPDLNGEKSLSSGRPTVVTTGKFLRRVQDLFDVAVETSGAEWFSAGRPT